MRYLSLFSGIEAATQAWKPLGWEAAAFSEIEPFPCAVLDYHYPNVPNLGDITEITEGQIKKLGQIDLVVGGSPCQSFSVAGLRKGLDDPRGNLTLEFLRIISLANPEFVVWENVPGVLSDKTGALQGLMNGLSELGYGVDLTEKDAQYFGVPQRRKRVFLVCRKTEGNIQTKKNSLSEITIIECLAKTLLCILGEHLKALGELPKDSVLQGVEISTAQKMISQYDEQLKSREPNHTQSLCLLHLLRNWVEKNLLCQRESRGSDSRLEMGLEIAQLTLGGVDTFPKMEQDNTSIGWLWQILSGENCEKASTSTTSTSTNPITIYQILSCASLVQNICGYIRTSKALQESLLGKESLFTTAIQEFMRYAKKTASKSFAKKHGYTDDDYICALSKRRVFDLANFGDWAGRQPILFEREGVCRDIEKGRKEGEGVAEDVGVIFEQRSPDGTPRIHSKVAPTLNTMSGGQREPCVVFRESSLGGYVEGEVGTIKASGGVLGGGSENFAIQGSMISRNDNAGPQGSGVGKDVSFTLNTADRHAVAYDMKQHHNPQETESIGLTTENCSKIRGDSPLVRDENMQVRRLTPTECSRLQNFPDDYLEIYYADAEEAHAAQILHELWREVRKKRPAHEEEGIKENRGDDLCEKHRVVAALLTQEVLLSGVYGGWFSWETLERYCEHARKSLQSESSITEEFLRNVQITRKTGCSPYQRESYGQFRRELNDVMSLVPHDITQSRKNLRDTRLWEEAQRTWPLRYSLAKKKKTGSNINPDSPRYKALGNSMAVPVMAFIGERIQGEVSG